jgi:hypothetical protein
VSVAGAALQPDQITVRLSVSGLLYRGYTVVASNVRDASCYQNLQPQTSETFQGPPVDVELPGGSIGARLALRAPFPNPARGENIVEFIAPVDGTTLRLEVTDLAGRRVRGLASGTWPAGTHRVRFDGRNEAGDRLAPGLYFVHLSRGSERLTRRFILLP